MEFHPLAMLTHPGTIWAQPEVAGVILQPWRPTLVQGVSSWSRGANTGAMEANPGVIWDPHAAIMQRWRLIRRVDHPGVAGAS
jgi:hypothetical protein